ncbi:unnamed protein product, partial [Nesidiocoris tenuis]
MGRAFMGLEPFNKAIHRCAAALAPEGLDLLNLIQNGTEETFDNILNNFVSIACIQVALVDTLTALGIKPDRIIGHSAGELGCAYADGAFTAEQTALAAYWRGKSILDAKLKIGAMAAVGLTWEEAKKRVPENIVAACHNGEDSVTVSGPPAEVDAFVKQLSSEGIFAKKVLSSGVAFHSKYIADAGPKLRSSLERVVTKIPENSLIIEIAPHALLQAVVKRAVPKNCINIGLTKKGLSDELGNFMANIGKKLMCTNIPSPGANGRLEWANNWISFMDTMLQFSLIGLNTRELYVPTRILKVVVDPARHLEVIGDKDEVPVQMYRHLGVTRSGGVEIRGMKASLAPRRTGAQVQAPPKLEAYTFVPYENTKVDVIVASPDVSSLAAVLEPIGAKTSAKDITVEPVDESESFHVVCGSQLLRHLANATPTVK